MVAGGIHSAFAGRKVNAYGISWLEMYCQLKEALDLLLGTGAA